MNIILKVLFAYIFLTSWVVRAEEWPEFPLPKNERVIIVGNNMVVNGQTMRIMEMTSQRSVKDIIEFYKKSWKSPVKKGAPGYIVNEAPPYLIISRPEKNFLMTAQVKKNGRKGSYSLLAISKTLNKNAVIKLGTGFPKMNTTTVLSDIASKDIHQEGRTLILENAFSINSNVNFYRDYYLKRGWNDVTQGNTSSNDMAVMIMNKNNDELNLTFNKEDNKTHIVVVEVTR